MWETGQGPPAPHPGLYGGGGVEAETPATSAINPPNQGHLSHVRWPLAASGTQHAVSVDLAPSALARPSC